MSFSVLRLASAGGDADDGAAAASTARTLLTAVERLMSADHNTLPTSPGAAPNTPCPVFSPWVRPSPKQHAYLLFGFTLARANARMLLNAASKRSSAKNAVRTSRSRSPVAGNE